MEAHEGFSIREYVSRMRTVNVVKCWPFDETTSEESVKSLLPPITVKKFIWWLDGVDYLHSENVDSSKKTHRKKKKKNKVVVVVPEKGESSSRNENHDNEEAIEEELKLKSSRAKAKAPKKRSILEIFAVAPPVERVQSSEEEDSVDEEDGFISADSKSSPGEEINWGLKGKRNEKNSKKKKLKKKNKDVILSKAKKVIKKIKKKRQKKGDKENCFMSKLQDQDKAIGNQDPSNELKKGNDSVICDPIISKKQPKVLQHVDREKKTAIAARNKAFKLIAQKQHQKRGILKNKAKEFSPTKCILLQESTQKADKHVTFSHKDNILRRVPDIQNEQDSIVSEAIGSEDAISRRINENEVSAISSNTTFDQMKDLGTSGPRSFPPMWFKDYLETYIEPSNTGPQDFSQRTSFNDARPIPYETLPYFSPKELLESAYSPLEGKRSMHGINEDFVGLPLNSQGELIRPSSSDKRDCNQLNLFPVKGAYLKENPVVFMPSRTNRDLDMININDHSLHSGISLYKEDSHFNQGNEKIISTMRLMGKEFTVGGRNSQEFEDGCIWKDKQIINEHHYNTNTSMPDQKEQSLGKLREFYPSEVIKIQHPFNFPHFDSQNSSMQQSNGFTTRKMNTGPSPVAFPAVYNSESLFPNPSSDIQLRNKQNLSHAPRSAIRFPFMHPDLEGHANRAQLFSENGTLMSNFQTYHNPGGPNHWTESSVSHKPEADFCLYNPFSSVGPISSPPTTLLIQQEPVHFYPRAVPVSSLQKRRINQKKINSRIGINGGLGHGMKPRRQLPGLSNLSQCAFTKSTVGVEFEDVEDIQTAFEPCSNLIYDEYGNDEHATRISPLGPVKLTAGAKHILKACQQIDHQSNIFRI